MKAFEVTPLAVVSGIPVTKVNDKRSVISVGHRSGYDPQVYAELDPTRYADGFPQRVFDCDVVHGDSVQIVPESEVTHKQVLIYWPCFDAGSLFFKVEGRACIYLESYTQRIGKSGGIDDGYAALVGLTNGATLKLCRRISLWSQWFGMANSDHDVIAWLQLNNDLVPVVTYD